MATKKTTGFTSAPTSALSETAKRALLDAAVEQSYKNIDTKFIETGDIGFDLAVSNGLGLPEGSSILLWAKQAVGKTTILGDICKRLLDEATRKGEDYKILFIAVENSKELLKSIGLGKYMMSKQLLYLTGQTNWRKIELYYDAVLQGYKDFAGVKLIIIDSVNQVLSDANVEKSGSDGDFGTRARERGNFYAKYLPVCSEKGITSVFISQVRKKQDAGMYEDPSKAAVTHADLHSVEVIFKCTKKVLSSADGQVEKDSPFCKVKAQKRYIVKLDSSCTDCKNRFFDSVPAEILVVKGVGVDNTYALRKLLEFNKYMKGSGGWFTFNTELSKALNLPDKKNMRISEVNSILRDNMGLLIDILKKAGKYCLDPSEVDLSQEETFDADEIDEEEAEAMEMASEEHVEEEDEEEND